MGSPSRASEPAKKPRRSRLWRWLLKPLALFLAILATLSLLYSWVMPPSTLMIGRWLGQQPVDRQVVPLGEIASHLPALVIASEDSGYCQHHGVDWHALRLVIRQGAKRGASTIAMQTTKNVFLWQEPALPRKIPEIPLALWLDWLWGKRRMMEIYLNIAEWDEGVFGAEAAALHYFGKSASRLGRHEAALLATALPLPGARNPARPSATHRRLAEQLLRRADRWGNLAHCL